MALSSAAHRMRRSGFTLAEMAIVVLIIGIAMSMGLKMINANLENAAYAETRSKQERLKIALISYLRANKRLPCPDTAAGVAGGAEVAPCASAALSYGVIPWQTLGLPRDAAVDGWGNLFTYRVHNVAATAIAASTVPVHKRSNQNWTTANGFDIVALNSSAAPGFQSILVNGAGGVVESRTAIAAILSHGKNGLGAKTINSGTRIPIAGAGADETTNATVGTLTFVRRPVTDNTATAGGAFDDVLYFLTPQDLLQPLVDERSVMACSAYCTAPPTAGCATTSAVPIGNPGPGLVCP